ncbi:hypothetical protein EDF70_105104 [Neorhizobium sp. JUb45]|nr:hypothetical protein EDF70_105104 [Neorhizobium sp. JUb45]
MSTHRRLLISFSGGETSGRMTTLTQFDMFHGLDLDIGGGCEESCEVAFDDAA